MATAIDLPRATAGQAETHDTVSEHSDIISAVGFERSAAGLFVGRDDEAARLARLLGLVDHAEAADAADDGARGGGAGERTGLVLMSQT